MSRVAVFDLDGFVYKAGFAGEKATIKVKHVPSGATKWFDNRTAFWGRGKKKDKGWLGDVNQERVERSLSPFHIDEFEIEDVVVVDPLPNLLHSAKMMINGALIDTNSEEMVGYIGGSDPLYRWERSVLQEYKGSRKNVRKPIHKDDIVEYYIKHQGATKVVGGLEADDWCIIKAVEISKSGDEAVVITNDKDVRGNPVLFFNPDRRDEGVQNGDCFGSIWLNDKGEVEGIGRLWKYFQVLHGDNTDDYRSNIYSTLQWGEKSVYSALKDIRTDKDAFKQMYDCFNMLYPHPMEIETWRGDKIVIDALFVFQEMFFNAHMFRTEDDFIDVKDILRKYKIIKGK